MIRSHALVFKDFESSWYKKWSKELRQTAGNLDGHKLHANKFWQNAAICEALYSRKKLQPGTRGLGFGVGQERLPSLFAKYGVKVLATDQDYHTKKATHWAQRELATGLNSLNRFGIVDDKTFVENVQYQAADMKDIPKELHNQFDFLWSNCALGHLGTIGDGIGFIKKSLRCLKPGGVAVHTTEVNVLSDSETVDSGLTVIFRLRDLYECYRELIEAGYSCSPIRFDLGRSERDFRLSMQPTFGNDYSKIQVGGHLATQVLLIIKKPKNPNLVTKKISLFKLKSAYLDGLDEINYFKKINPNFRALLESKATHPDAIKLVPLKTNIKTSIPEGKSRTIFIEYANESKVPLYSLYGHLNGAFPLVLATNEPKNHLSKFADKKWAAENKSRPSSTLKVKNKQGNYEDTDHINPGQKFAFEVILNTNKLKKGTYTENFIAVLEGGGWVAGSNVNVNIKIF
jgi:SAM-dependent methyltransferase